jgi:hypothetical protein
LRRDVVARWRTRLRGLPDVPGSIRDAVRELAGQRAVAPRCSLNRPTGPRRRARAVQADLAGVVDLAHAHGATVNDVVLTAVSGALAALLRRRGEHVDRLVVSILIAARPVADVATIGNQAGVAPLALPTDGTRDERLRRVAAITRTAKRGRRGSSAALLGLGLRVLGRLRLLRWFTDRQRMVHTFVTNLRGPDRRVDFAGMPVVELIPVSLATGNVTVAFAALSYAGTLTVTIVADPDHIPDLDGLVDALDDEFSAGPGCTGGSR